MAACGGADATDAVCADLYAAFADQDAARVIALKGSVVNADNIALAYAYDQAVEQASSGPLALACD